MKYTKYVSGTLVAASLAVAAVAIPLSTSFANAAGPRVTGSFGVDVRGQGGMQGRPQGNWGDRNGVRPAVFGTVSAINGDSLTVTQGAHPAFGGFGSSTPAMAATATTTYTVDATNATVLKNNATSTVSSISVGDKVAVQGTVNGTNVTATTIRDGFSGMGRGMMGGMRGGGNASSTNAMPSPITGNGQPVIAGTIGAINGSSLTITNKSNVSYTVDASNAKIVEGQSVITVSNLAVGDNVIVQGVVNGTSVTASSVIDQKAPSAGANNNASSTGPRGGHSGNGGGIFGAIGGFFSHIFGF